MINRHLYEIERENSFSKATAMIKEHKKAHPERDVVSLGIGDVSRPIVKPVIEAMHKAVDDLADMSTFQGYGLYYGLEALRKKIAEKEYSEVGIGWEEVYVGDGTKSDSVNILELFDKDSKILVGDPMYPIYLNGCHAYSKEIHFAKNDENFKMMVPQEKYDIIYLCSPSNPIGNALDREELKKWIDYAIKNDANIIYDNVYKDFVESDNVPKTIYEIEGAKKVAVELRSFSKSVSMSSARCSYYVIPKEIDTYLWKERCISRFNGASYVSQVGAVASYSDEAQKLIKENVVYYKENARYLKENLIAIGYECIGGVDTPYIWMKTDMSSWDAFAFFLHELDIVTMPGIIFGPSGDGYVRLSGLGPREHCIKAVERIKKYHEEKN